MIKKIISLFFIASISVGTIGCNLSKDEDSYRESENLRGVFVTYTLDGVGKDYDTYDKRYYGEIVEDGDYKYLKFEGIEGESIFLQQEGKDGGRYNTILSSRVFQNQSLNIHTKDNTDYSKITFEDSNKKQDENIQIIENKIEATLYVTSKFKGIVDINPIIKEDCRYFTQRQSASIYIDGVNGGITSSSQSSSTTSKISKQETETFTYDIKIETIDEVKSIKVKEMNEEDKVISTEDINHISDTYEYKISENTQYVIVEETCINSKGKETKKRTIYDRDSIENESAIHMCAYVNEDYLVVPKYLKIII